MISHRLLHSRLLRKVWIGGILACCLLSSFQSLRDTGETTALHTLQLPAGGEGESSRTKYIRDTHEHTAQHLLRLQTGGEEESSGTKFNATLLPPTNKGLLLHVPFYVYEDLWWYQNATVGNLTFDAWIQEREAKHTDDFWFAKAALQHPMRTLDAAKARLFIIPTLFNELSDQLSYYKQDLCVGARCNTDLLKDTDEYLRKSPWFQRSQGKDHILTASHYSSHHYLQHYPNLGECNVIGYHEIRWNDPERITLPKIFVGTRCDSQPKTHDFAMVASMKNLSTFASRHKVCKWTKEANLSVAHCGRGSQCPALAQSRFGFHVRGDNFGSNRLLDTILSQTVPIFTFREQYQLVPPWIDWKGMSYFANVQNRSAFLSRLGELVDTSPSDYHAKLEYIRKNRDLVDWWTSVPFEIYMYVFARKIVPEYQERIYTTPYSALRLDVIEEFETDSSTVWCGERLEKGGCTECTKDPPHLIPVNRDMPPTRIERNKKLCGGQCAWCPFGARESSKDSIDRCFPRFTNCRTSSEMLKNKQEIVSH
jgi:hypothetical protein